MIFRSHNVTENDSSELTFCEISPEVEFLSKFGFRGVVEDCVENIPGDLERVWMSSC